MTTAGSTPSVAVIIPSFNRWPLVADAIESAMNQSYLQTRVIIVDDASTDGTPNLIHQRFGNRVQLVAKTQNGEKSRARNDGVRAAEADFVCMLDSDDILLPNAIADRLRVFQEKPCFDGVSYGAARGANERNGMNHIPMPSGDILNAYLDNVSILNNNAYLISRANMLRLGMYQPELTHMEDRELLIRLTAQLPFHFCGTVVQEVRRVKESAQSEFEKFLCQGRAMTATLRRNKRVMERLNGRFESIAFIEDREIARACYKSGKYKQFLRVVDSLYQKYPEQMQRDVRFKRRRVVAWAMTHLS